MTTYDYVTEFDPGFNEGKVRYAAPTHVLQVYGTPTEARKYIAEEFGLPAIPPPVTVLPPYDIRSGPTRTLTVVPPGSVPGDLISQPTMWKQIVPATGLEGFGTVASGNGSGNGWFLTIGAIIGGFVLARVAAAMLERRER
jgi:hypothetical protein